MKYITIFDQQLKTKIITPRAKKYLSISKRYDTADRNATKYESGFNYDPIKGYKFREVANGLINQMNSMNLTDEENDEITEAQGC